MKKKVLFVLTKFDVGGAQKYVADLAENLNKKSITAEVVYGGKDIKWLSNKTNPWLFFINDLLAIFELIKIYQNHLPDIIHLNSSKAGILGSIAAFIHNVKLKNYKPKTKIVFTAHGWVFNPTNEISSWERKFYILLHWLAAKLQDKIICVSEYDYQLAIKYKIAPLTKLITIPNGINPDIPFLNKSEARKRILEKINIKKNIPEYRQFKLNAPWMGSIGRLTKEKDYETFIRSAQFIPKANFFIIGEGPRKEKLKELKNQLKSSVTIIEPTGKDYLFLKAFDIFVMSSVKEGCPYSLLEAMAAGLPVVVTETGGMPEMIKNHSYGLMVAQKNPEMLAKAMQGILANHNVEKEMAQKEKNIVEKKFSLKKMVEETEFVYKNL